MSIEDQLQEPLIEEVKVPIIQSGAEKPKKSSSKKRKRGGNHGEEELKQKPNEAGKRRKHAINDEDVDVEAGLNNAIAKMNDHLLVDYVASQTRRYESDLSSVELEDRYLPG